MSPERDAELLVVTPWYPGPENPYSGSFVRESVRAVLRYYGRITVIHVENRPPEEERAPSWSLTDEGRVLWLPVAIDPLASRADMILAQREALRAHALPLIEAAATIHCHVGAPTGAALVELVGERTRLVITEHATYLANVLRNPDASALYGRAVARADVFTAVSSGSAALIERSFPTERDHVTVVPNPVPLSTYPVKTELSAAMARWLYVGYLTPYKGVRRLVRAFAAWVADTRDERASLTLVGLGPLREELAELADELGVAARVRFAGAVEPERVGRLYAEHDVLVHLSHGETFGMTCVEAAACGLPVVVTRCGGPQATLATHAALGLATFVPIGDEHEVESVVAALSRLQRSVDPGNIALSRRYLRRVFGAEAIGAVLHSALSGDPLPRQPLPLGIRVLAVAITPRQARDAEASLRRLTSHGGSGLYLTTQPPASPLPGSVRVIDISAASDRLRRRVDALRSRHRRPGQDIPDGPRGRIWRLVRPWLTARKLDAAGVLGDLDLASVDCLLLPDDNNTPIAVRLLRVAPDLDVRRSWPGQPLARRYAERAQNPTGSRPAR